VIQRKNTVLQAYSSVGLLTHCRISLDFNNCNALTFPPSLGSCFTIVSRISRWTTEQPRIF